MVTLTECQVVEVCLDSLQHLSSTTLMARLFRYIAVSTADRLLEVSRMYETRNKVRRCCGST